MNGGEDMRAPFAAMRSEGENACVIGPNEEILVEITHGSPEEQWDMARRVAAMLNNTPKAVEPDERQPEGLAGELGFERLNHAMCELRAAIGYLGINHYQVTVGVLGEANAQRVRDVLPEAIPTGPGSQLCDLQGIQVHQFKSRGPIPLILTCPGCNERHVDEGEFASKPHHTHACQGCGLVWRPAKVATVGVQFLPGYKDEARQ